MSKKIALVGTCPSSKMLAPYGDPSWEIWACGPDNAGDGGLPRVDRWFEIHGDLGLPGGEAWEKSYIDWLNQQSFPLIVTRQDLFPRGLMLPKDLLIKVFSPLFFSSTPAWMLGMALVEQAEVIGLYGLDMSSRHEYLIQRPGMHHMIWAAENIFKRVIIAPMESDILQPAPLYGYDLSTPRGRKTEIRRREVQARVSGLDKQIAALTTERTMLSGALDDLDYFQTIWAGDKDPALDQPIPAAEAEQPERPGKVVNFKE